MDFCYLDGICTPKGMFIFIILVIHRETGGISQLGLSYQINEENGSMTFRLKPFRLKAISSKGHFV